MGFAIEFIETSIFTKQFNEIANDSELQALQEELIAYPESGDLITGTGGLRKIRITLKNRGKSGGARVIYFLANKEVVYLVLAYQKSNKSTLSNVEKTVLKKLTKQLKEEVKK